MGRRKKGQKINGWINLDKPLGVTSTQALARVRRKLDAQKAGHAGTLDPLATGVLPIALGEATKVIPYVQDAIKSYAFTVKWGEATETDDAEGDVIETSDRRPSEDEIKAILMNFTGEIEQTPPKYSAIKIDGQRAYDLARDGQDVEIKSRQVFIESLDVIGMRAHEADFRAVCGKGTYIRSLARDIAKKLGTCGHIKLLQREQVGWFHQNDAISLDIFEEIDDIGALNEHLRPLEAPLDDIPALPLTDKQVLDVRNGRKLSFISKPDFDLLTQCGFGKEKKSGLALGKNQNKAIALFDIEGPYAQPIRVFNT